MGFSTKSDWTEDLENPCGYFLRLNDTFSILGEDVTQLSNYLEVTPGSIIEVRFDKRKKHISFFVDQKECSITFLVEADEPIYPAAIILNNRLSYELL